MLLVTVGANTTSFPVTGLAAGQGYAFRVEAYNAVNSASTGWQYVTLPYDRVAAPAWLNVVAVSSSQVNVTWPDVTGETGYRVYRGDGAILATLGASATSYQATGLAAGQTYAFRVEAFNGGSLASTGWQWVATPYDRVTAPGWLQVWPSGNRRVNLYCGDAANETGYRIWHWENGRAVLIATVGPNTTFFQTGYFARYQYHWFLVEAFNAGSQASSAWQGLWL